MVPPALAGTTATFQKNDQIKKNTYFDELGVEKMKLQSLLLPQTGICTEEKMYFRRQGTIDFTWDKNYLGFFRDSSISFDTYFNGCSAEKWFKYTKIKKISIRQAEFEKNTAHKIKRLVESNKQ